MRIKQFLIAAGLCAAAMTVCGQTAFGADRGLTADSLYRLIINDGRFVSDVRPIPAENAGLEKLFAEYAETVRPAVKEQGHIAAVNLAVQDLHALCDSLSRTTLEMMASEFVRLEADNVRQCALMEQCLGLAEKAGRREQMEIFFREQYVPLQSILRGIGNAMTEMEYWGGTLMPVASTISEDNVIGIFSELLEDVLTGSYGVAGTAVTGPETVGVQAALITQTMRDYKPEEEDRIPFSGFEASTITDTENLPAKTEAFATAFKAVFDGLTADLNPTRVEMSLNAFYVKLDEYLKGLDHNIN